MCEFHSLVFGSFHLLAELSRFEIAIATIISFIAAALASTNYFCYTALVSGGVVLILPVCAFSGVIHDSSHVRAHDRRVTLCFVELWNSLLVISRPERSV